MGMKMDSSTMPDGEREHTRVDEHYLHEVCTNLQLNSIVVSRGSHMMNRKSVLQRKEIDGLNGWMKKISGCDRTRLRLHYVQVCHYK